MRQLTAQNPYHRELKVADAPPRRPGSGPVVNLLIKSAQPTAEEIATGTRQERNTQAYIDAVHDAADMNICVTIDCWGGRGDGAHALANALLAHPWHVETHIVGRCASGTCLIALAGDRRLMAQTATILIHGARLIMTPDDYARLYNMPKPAQDAVLDRLSLSDAQTEAFIVARTKLPRRVVRGWLKTEHEMSANEALACGFVTELCDN